MAIRTSFPRLPRLAAVGILLLIALGNGCSHSRVSLLIVQDAAETGPGRNAPAQDQAALDTPAGRSTAAPGPHEISSAVDHAGIHPVDDASRCAGTGPPAAIAPRVSDFPIVVNDRVKAALTYLKTHRSDDIARAFWRARRYAGMMRAIFREYDLPEELVNLAFVESDVNPRATSHAQAVGIWQFVPSTARTYGMRTTGSVDERRDPEKSTRAAAEHLKALYDHFEAWPLALAAYNAGENAVQRTIRRQRTRNFWQLRLPKETRRFVPKFMAMTLISRDPKRYGFSPPPEDPHDTEFLQVTQPTEIRQIAEAAGTTVTHLRELNPELVGAATPSDEPRYTLRIPRRFTWISHKVQKGDSVATIARRYRVRPQLLREVNGLGQGDDLKAGRIILVPAKASPPPA